MAPEIAKVFPEYRVSTDGSGVEVITPILQGESGLSELRDVMELLRDMGGQVTDSDGLHVHHDAPEYLVDDDELAQKRIVTLAQSWCNNQAIINELVLEHRRSDWFKCELEGFAPTSCYIPLTQSYVDGLKQWVKAADSPYYGPRKAAQKIGGTRFYALNVTSLSDKGTIEVRQYQGTLNFDRAQAWVKFGQAFIETALQDDDVPIAPYDSIDTLMRDMGLDSYDRGTLLEVGV